MMCDSSACVCVCDQCLVLIIDLIRREMFQVNDPDAFLLENKTYIIVHQAYKIVKYLFFVFKLIPKCLKVIFGEAGKESQYCANSVCYYED